MKKLLTALRAACAIALVCTPYATAKAIFTGAIQFPSSMHTMPAMRIFYNGYKIETITHAGCKKIMFDIPEENNCEQFYVLITDKIDFKTEDHNTIEYLKRCPNVAYKLFSITQNNDGAWAAHDVTHEQTDVRIPDNTIIVYYQPDLIEQLTDSNNHVALPTIAIKHTEEAKLQEAATMALLSSIEANTVHGNVQKITTNQRLKTIVTIS